MTPEIIARVDAWMASREAWINSQQHRMGLRHTWTIISEALTTWRTHGPQTKCYEVVGYDECGAVTALTGILLALVREAWNDPGVYVQHRGVDGWWVWGSDPRKRSLAHQPAEAEALVIALGAAFDQRA